MTEVVHCKSHRERGVKNAAPICFERHVDSITGLSPAPRVVVLGGKARDLLGDRLSLEAGFGSRGTVGVDQTTNLAIRVIGSRDRVIAYLWHPTA